ncbi:hypothetical protein CP10139811_0154 [Chlamydia ibidis]|uniref:Uncharacterized protein n=1 Tax=Chlamydia ibidis TaxID=1405396 RepID=S7J4G6_9CHLA|nr:hypothetical protein CP10139811_0154 [Chlamydia ibidis]
MPEAPVIATVSPGYRLILILLSISNSLPKWETFFDMFIASIKGGMPTPILEFEKHAS